MLNPGWTSPHLAFFCLQKPPKTKLYPFTESNRTCWRKFVEKRLVVHPMYKKRRFFVVVGETLFGKSRNWCRANVGIDASQLYLSTMCQVMLNGLHTRWELVFESGNFKSCQNKPMRFENLAKSCFQGVRPQSGKFLHGRNTEKNVAFAVDGFFGHCNTVFEALDRYSLYYPSQ